MPDPDPTRDLSRRERQAMDVLYRLGRASATEIHAELPDPPSTSSVRSMLRLLVEKGLVRHEPDGPRYVYEPVVPREHAGTRALRHLVSTFFGGSAEEAAATLLSLEDGDLDERTLERLRHALEQAREEGR